MSKHNIISETKVPPFLWENFLRRIAEEKINLHAALLSRGDSLQFESYTKELGEDSLYRLFSVSKSVSALAIGCLAEEGKLSLNDPILTHYPEYEEGSHTWLQQMTIRDMLRMETCHQTTTYKIDPAKPWVESFFVTPPDHAPGQVFFYDTSSSHVLANLVERLAGTKILDYLRDRGLREAGLSEKAYFLEDPQGSPLGGSGLMATARDFWLIACVVMMNGSFANRQIFPPDFCREATSLQTATAQNASFREESYGYGYQFWRHRAGWMMYGMGGQLAICVPDLQLLLITTGDSQKYKSDIQRIFDSFFSEIADPLRSGADNENCDRISEFRSLPLAGPKGKGPKRLEKNVNLTDGTFSVSVSDESGYFCLRLDDEELAFPFAFGSQQESRLQGSGHRVFASATWHTREKLGILVQVIDEEVGFIEVTLAFGQSGELVLALRNNIESSYKKWQGVWTLQEEASHGNHD